MVTTPTAAGGLSTSELEFIRDTLAAGRRPRVVFTESAGQIAGQIGQVVALTDPDLSDEWLTVRFGRDELPFSPTDLAIPPKKKRASSPPTPRQESAVTATTTTPPVDKPVDQPTDPPAERPTPPARPAKKAARQPKPPPGLTVTLAYTAGEWTVAAHQGSKALAKPYVIKPTEALQMVGMIDVTGVHEAVEQIVNAERAEAEGRAEKLRAELAEVESRLADLRDAG